MSIKARMICLYVALVAVYAATTFLLPPPQNELARFHIGTAQLRIVDLIILVPYVLIWLVGFYAYTALKTYAQPLKNTPDGRHVLTLARGILWLILWLPLSSIIANWFGFMTDKYPDTSSALTAIGHYFNLLLPLIGFIIIGKAARGLAKVARLQLSNSSQIVLNIILILLGVFYTYLIVGTDVVQGFSSFPYLPHWLILLTVVAPYIYMWFTGLLATYQLYLYCKKVPGVLYRQTWRLLALGVGAILVIQVVVQYISTLVTLFADRLSIGGAIMLADRLSIRGAVLFEYGVLVLLSIGYILVASGAKKLQKIEEA